MAKKKVQKRASKKHSHHKEREAAIVIVLTALTGFVLFFLLRDAHPVYVLISIPLIVVVLMKSRTILK